MLAGVMLLFLWFSMDGVNVLQGMISWHGCKISCNGFPSQKTMRGYGSENFTTTKPQLTVSQRQWRPVFSRGGGDPKGDIKLKVNHVPYMQVQDFHRRELGRNTSGECSFALHPQLNSHMVGLSVTELQSPSTSTGNGLQAVGWGSSSYGHSAIVFVARSL